MKSLLIVSALTLSVMAQAAQKSNYVGLVDCSLTDSNKVKTNYTLFVDNENALLKGDQVMAQISSDEGSTTADTTENSTDGVLDGISKFIGNIGNAFEQALIKALWIEADAYLSISENGQTFKTSTFKLDIMNTNIMRFDVHNMSFTIIQTVEESENTQEDSKSHFIGYVKYAGKTRIMKCAPFANKDKK